MRIKVTCESCASEYFCNPSNTIIKSPIITSICPVCKTAYQGNVSAFAFYQADTKKVEGRIHRAAFMITLMQNISAAVNEDNHGIKMRKYVARRWNTQHTT